jgi:hypothetical protein
MKNMKIFCKTKRGAIKAAAQGPHVSLFLRNDVSEECRFQSGDFPVTVEQVPRYTGQDTS